MWMAECVGGGAHACGGVGTRASSGDELRERCVQYPIVIYVLLRSCTATSVCTVITVQRCVTV